MENASKALIIAGAILISILLISVGVMVMSSTDEVTGGMEEEMNRAAIEEFNGKFAQYAGDQKGASIKTLMNTMSSSNASSQHKVKVYAGTTETTASKVTASVKSTTTYNVEISDEDSDGYYDKITITGLTISG